MKQSLWDKIIYDTYVELYKNSEPSADFDELLKYAKDNNIVDRTGRYIIPYMDYEIDKDKMDKIVQSFIKKHKMKKHTASQYSFSIYLGCSPKTKIDD